jgi:hypothetical protein
MEGMLASEPDSYRVEILFREPDGLLGTRQVKALFDLVDEAVLTSVVALLGTEQGAVGGRVDLENRSAARDLARYLMENDNAWPRVVALHFESPPRVVLATRSVRRAAALVASVAILFGATAEVLEQADNMLREAQSLISTIEHFGVTRSTSSSRVALKGRGTEPSLDLAHVVVHRERRP